MENEENKKSRGNGRERYLSCIEPTLEDPELVKWDIEKLDAVDGILDKVNAVMDVNEDIAEFIGPPDKVLQVVLRGESNEIIDERNKNAKTTNKDDEEPTKKVDNDTTHQIGKNNEENKQDGKDNKANKNKVDNENNGTDMGTEEETNNEELEWPCAVCRKDASDNSVKCIECELWTCIDPCSELPNTNAPSIVSYKCPKCQAATKRKRGRPAKRRYSAPTIRNTKSTEIVCEDIFKKNQ